MIIARWHIDARFGQKQAVIDSLNTWLREIASQIGWTSDKVRIATGSIGALESTIEVDVMLEDLSELNAAWNKLGSIPAHKEWSRQIEPCIVSGTPRWQVFRVVGAAEGRKFSQHVLTRMQAELLRQAADAEAGPGGFSMGALIGTSLVSRDLQEAFLGRYLAHKESPEDFWSSLEDDPLFSTEGLYELRLVLFVGKVAHYKLPLLEQLKELRQAQAITTLRDISLIPGERWRQLLARSRVGLDAESFVQDLDRTFDTLLFGGCA